MKRFRMVIVVMVTMFWCGSAMALNEDACNDFPHNWGPDTVCLGMYELSDMGWFDADGEWQWYQSFLKDPYMNHSASGWPNDFNLIKPFKVDDFQVQGIRLDNKIHPDGSPQAGEWHRLVLTAIKSGIHVPNIWKMEVGPVSRCRFVAG
jgi:hypothetical protein